MKLVVYIFVADFSHSQWHHYSLEVYPATMGGRRLTSSVYDHRPAHPVIRSLQEHEHNVSAETMQEQAGPIIEEYDPNADMFGLIMTYNSRDYFDDYSYRRIKRMLESHPYINPEDVTIVYTRSGVPRNTLSLKGYEQALFDHLYDDEDDEEHGS